MQRILVTGANRGIGLEFTRRFLTRGAHVFATCRQPGQAQHLTELAAAHPGRLNVLPLELTNERSIAELIHELAALTKGIDILINNAGVLASNERFGTLSAKNINSSFYTNTTGPILLTQALADLLAKGSNAKVINISSILGSIARTSEFATPSYNISKAALNMATRLLALALAPRGIIVIAAHPGWVQTDMGGPRAPLTTHQSVSGLLRVIDGLKTTNNGHFLDYQGTELPW